MLYNEPAKEELVRGVQLTDNTDHRFTMACIILTSRPPRAVALLLTSERKCNS